MGVIDRTQLLSMWTVYDRPLDMPDSIVARRWEVHPDGPRATPDVITASTLDAVRSEFYRRGLSCLPRSPGDEPHIVETWL